MMKFIVAFASKYVVFNLQMEICVSLKENSVSQGVVPFFGSMQNSYYEVKMIN